MGLMLLNQVHFARRAASRPGVQQREVRVAVGWEVWPWQSPHLTTWEDEGGRAGREDEGCHPLAAGWLQGFVPVSGPAPSPLWTETCWWAAAHSRGVARPPLSKGRTGL